MGYTHYWNILKPLDPDKFNDFTADIRALVFAAPGHPDAQQPLVIAGPTGNGEPILNDDGFGLNGDGPLCCETFAISAEDTGFDFCKTRALPYDIVVTAALVALKHHFGDAVSVSTDGTAYDWKAGVQLCQDFNRETKLWQREKETLGTAKTATVSTRFGRRNITQAVTAR